MNFLLTKFTPRQVKFTPGVAGQAQSSTPVDVGSLSKPALGFKMF